MEEQSSSYKPLSKYIKDKYGDNRGTAAVDFPVGNAKGIDGVIDGCFGEQGITYSHWAKITATFDDLVFALLKEYNLQLILFGRLPDVSGDDSLCDHAVIAYGHTSDDMQIVHYGWENYSKVILDNIIYMSGSMYQITSCSAPTSDPCYPFSDLSYHWARKYISNCVEHGCMGGTTATKWAPEISMTRAMFVTVLYRMAGSPATTISHPFTDVPSSSYYAKAVSWPYKNNLVNGTAVTTFTPDRAVTREQSVCFLHRFATFRNYMYSTHSVSTSRYPD